VISYELAAVFHQLQMPGTRAEGTRALAALAGAREVLLFGLDSEVKLYLPAPGLPQTLRDGNLWQGFLRECARDGSAVANMPDPDQGSDTPAFGMTDADGLAIVVFMTARPAPALDRPIRALLPLLGAKLALERSALAAEGQAAAARAGCQHAMQLVAALEAARSELQGANDAAQRALDQLRRAD